jgi:hypothetical protein
MMTLASMILGMTGAFYLGCYYTQEKCDRRLRQFGRHIDKTLNEHRDQMARLPR